MTKLELLRIQFEKSLNRFEEVLKKDKDPITRDSAIKRFELTFDLAWKLLKEALNEKKGILCFSPKDCFREAFRAGIIDNDHHWIEIVDLKNYSVHAYDEAFADYLHEKLPGILKMFKKLREKLLNL